MLGKTQWAMRLLENDPCCASVILYIITVIIAFNVVEDLQNKHL